MWPFLGSLISAGTSFLGGMFGQNQADEQYWNAVKRSNRQFSYQKQQNKKQWAFANLWADKNFDFAKQQAHRQTLEYKIGEAKKHGVHPLYALGGGSSVGAPGISGPAISVGAGGPVGYSGDGGMASAISQAGQHLGRAVDSMATQEQRNLARVTAALGIENQGLQNELLRSQIRRIDAQTGPAIPGPGQKYLIDGQGNVVGKTNIDAVQFSQRYPESKQNVQLGDIWQANPYVSNAEDVEARHGELADMLWGAITIPADIYWNNRSSIQRGYDWLRGQTLEGR